MANIRDIAKHAGVSVSTVSRVLNNYPYISEEKKLKVLAAMETLNYIPNHLAVNLSYGKSRVIAVVLPWITNPYYLRILEGAIKQASKHNYHIIVIETHYEEAEELKVLEMLKHRSIDGIIFTTRQISLKTICDYETFGPIIVMEKNDHLPYIFINQYEALKKALYYLIEQGYKKIGYTLHRKNGFSANERAKAYATIPENMQYEDFIYVGGLSVTDGMRLAHNILNQKNLPDALIVTNDAVSAGIYAAFQNQNVKVPEDIALISYENGELSQINNITSVDLPLVKMGESSVDLILTDQVESQELPSSLIIRKST
ncbi:LacI family DNA-binding transcriptional regulator [Macrococcus sp. EM39E]|uniref:LacI family DNA-binding transcriptional regulator n=1 Tax=Macrococcus animalis TaxID=3395467 RepID=UPI0039BF1714